MCKHGPVYAEMTTGIPDVAQVSQCSTAWGGQLGASTSALHKLSQACGEEIQEILDLPFLGCRGDTDVNHLSA